MLNKNEMILEGYKAINYLLDFVSKNALINAKKGIHRFTIESYVK